MPISCENEIWLCFGNLGFIANSGFVSGNRFKAFGFVLGIGVRDLWLRFGNPDFTQSGFVSVNLALFRESGILTFAPHFRRADSRRLDAASSAA